MFEWIIASIYSVPALFQALYRYKLMDRRATRYSKDDCFPHCKDEEPELQRGFLKHSVPVWSRLDSKQATQARMRALSQLRCRPWLNAEVPQPHEQNFPHSDLTLPSQPCLPPFRVAMVGTSLFSWLCLCVTWPLIPQFPFQKVTPPSLKVAFRYHLHCEAFHDSFCSYSFHTIWNHTSTAHIVGTGHVILHRLLSVLFVSALPRNSLVSIFLKVT